MRLYARCYKTIFTSCNKMQTNLKTDHIARQSEKEGMEKRKRAGEIVCESRKEVKPDRERLSQAFNNLKKL